jgi:glycosyltransferase involved in cell wall biosynthesis
MKISIITVCYNSETSIDKTLQSIANQTYKDIEYIIIDGGSTDGTLDLIEKYRHNITKQISEVDAGLYDAMNKGIQLATGELVGILNSDDTFFNNHVLEDVSNFHKKHVIEASIGDIVQHNEHGKIVRTYKADKWNPQKLKIGFMPPHPAIFFKRSLFDTFGLYELDFIIGADYELITRFFLKNNITWKYSGMTTTAMLIGGLSSSGMSSYKLISKEIGKALDRNNIDYSPLKVKLRGFWKIVGILRK